MEFLGKTCLSLVLTLGDFVRFFVAILAGIFRGVDRFGLREMLSQMFDLGTLSIPVVMLTGFFIGAVLVIEAYPQFHALGLASRLGSVTVLSVVKQIGPVLTGVMLAGRVGGAMTAELGTMRVTEQIEALRSMAADPVRTLAVPRVLASDFGQCREFRSGELEIRGLDRITDAAFTAGSRNRNYLRPLGQQPGQYYLLRAYAPCRGNARHCRIGCPQRLGLPDAIEWTPRQK